MVEPAKHSRQPKPHSSGRKAVTIERLETDLTRVRAPNPGPLTGTGTNSYVVGRNRLAVIDPGPAAHDHLATLVRAIDGRPVDVILVTHSHLDHSPLAHDLARETGGAPIAAFGRSGVGRSTIMDELANQGDIGGGEGVDPGFDTTIALEHGAQIIADGEPITALHTPGHFGNHLCFAWRDALFSGDHVMGWATTLISPPDGDLTDFMASCKLLLDRNERVYYPGHGDPIDNPQERVEWLISHRLEREAQVLDALSRRAATPAQLTQMIYTDVSPKLWPAAQRNVLAHLIDLTVRERVRPVGTLSMGAIFEIA